jgi:hypothetical protein
MDTIRIKKIEDAVNETRNLLEKVRDRLGIKATIKVDTECGENDIIIYFDRWLSITVFWGEYETIIGEQICYGVDVEKVYPATYMEPEVYDTIDQGTFNKPCIAINKIINLYYQNEINNVFISIDEENLEF